VFAAECNGDISRFESVFVIAEVMGEAGGGDGGDGNFVEKVGGSAGPLRSPFHQGGDGFQDWRRWIFVEGVKDGLAMGGECGNGPLGGIRGSGQGAGDQGLALRAQGGADSGAEGREDGRAEGFEILPEIGFGAAGQWS